MKTELDHIVQETVKPVAVALEAMSTDRHVRQAIVKLAVETFVWGMEEKFPHQIPDLIEHLRAMADLAEDDFNHPPQK